MHRRRTTVDEALAALDRRARAAGHALWPVIRSVPARARALPGPTRALLTRASHTVRTIVPALPALLPILILGLSTELRRRLTPLRAAAGVLVLVSLVAGVTSLLTTAGEAPRVDTAIASDADRATAAERADRSARDEASSPDQAAGAATPTTATVEPVPEPVPPGPPPAWVNPMPGAPLSSCYGWRWGAMHQGIDFAGTNGTPILAAGEGTIIGTGWLYSGYGISVVIDHGNGLLTHYAHASSVNVIVGQHVTPGMIIAYEGSTGDSTGPHLHFEIHAGGLWSQVNPAPWLRGQGVSIGC